MSPLEHSTSILNSKFLLNIQEIFDFLSKTLKDVFNEDLLQNDSLIFIFLGIIILVFCSAFFSASETAFSTVNVMRLRTYAQEKRRGARKALWIAENYERTVTTILVGNNFVNILATTLAGTAFALVFAHGTVADAASTIIMTLAVLIFRENLTKY